MLPNGNHRKSYGLSRGTSNPVANTPRKLCVYIEYTYRLFSFPVGFGDGFQMRTNTPSKQDSHKSYGVISATCKSLATTPRKHVPYTY